ncbi:MAG: Txe/YoeB family addiction module toxin [Candidatus Competibacteraceae bacterium]|nr:MAG: Txe/YoeB family addiction module toxin [Candidatus Competibacteraceae bacterium]
MKWNLVYTKQAQKDAKKLVASGLKGKTQSLLEVLEENPYRNPPPYEKLVGNLVGAYSKCINIQHRIVYQILEKERGCRPARCPSHGRVRC